MPGFLADVLSREHNHLYRTAIKAARSWGVSPRQMMLGHPQDWDEIDTRLCLALTLLENETCSSCGTPAWIGFSTNNEITFRTDTATCYGCAELDRTRASHAKQHATRHGKRDYVIPAMWDSSPLPPRADEYARRDAIQQRQQEQQEGR